jgi:hypothetical protein
MTKKTQKNSTTYTSQSSIDNLNIIETETTSSSINNKKTNVKKTEIMETPTSNFIYKTIKLDIGDPFPSSINNFDLSKSIDKNVTKYNKKMMKKIEKIKKEIEKIISKNYKSDQSLNKFNKFNIKNNTLENRIYYLINIYMDQVNSYITKYITKLNNFIFVIEAKGFTNGIQYRNKNNKSYVNIISNFKDDLILLSNKINALYTQAEINFASSIVYNTANNEGNIGYALKKITNNKKNYISLTESIIKLSLCYAIKSDPNAFTDTNDIIEEKYRKSYIKSLTEYVDKIRMLLLDI